MTRRGMVIVGLALGMLPAATGSASTGEAVISGTAADSPITGQVILTDTPEGLQITAEVFQAPEGRHGFHIHEFGRCTDSGKAAGGHFNPDGRPHGDLLGDGVSGAHAGDLGNLTVGPDGTGSFSRVYPALSLHGDPYPVAGRAFILHAAPDDFGQPTGHAGARIGCGSIRITGH